MLRGDWDFVRHGMVTGLGFNGWDIADEFQQPPVVEPIHPFERGILDGFERAPWPAPVDHLGLVKAIDRLDLQRFCAGHLCHYATLASNASGLMPPKYECRLRVL